MESRLRFRLAGREDAAVLAAFMARNFIAAYGHCSTPENIQAAVAQHYGLQAQERQIADPSRINLVVESGAELVGHSQLHAAATAPPGALAQPAIEVSRFYVDSTRHGSGVAQAMMAETRTRALSAGARSLYLSVWKDAPQAIRFYEKSGFRIAGELVFMVGDDPKQDWLMVSALSPPEVV